METTATNFYTAGEIAARWGISLRYAYALIERGALTGVRIGRAVRVPDTEIFRYEQDHKTGVSNEIR